MYKPKGVSLLRCAFTKEQLVKADRWFNRRDLLNALLEDDKTYTIEQVDDLIKEYYKKPI